MGTDVRPEISKKNKYYITKHRFYELKHYCLQYGEWEELYYALQGINTPNARLDARLAGIFGSGNSYSDNTSYYGIATYDLGKKMSDIRKIIYDTDSELYEWLFLAITKGITYTELKMCYDIPCCKDTFYDRYRKFFFTLSSVRR